MIKFPIPDSTRIRYIYQKIGFGFLTAIAILTVLPILGTITYIILKGLPAMSWQFLTSFPHEGMTAGGIMPAITGTFLLTLGTALFSVPLGIGAAIYLLFLL